MFTDKMFTVKMVHGEWLGLGLGLGLGLRLGLGIRVRASEHFVVNILSWTFCREHFVVNILSWTFCRWTFCLWTFCREHFVVNILSWTFCRWTFCRGTFCRGTVIFTYNIVWFWWGGGSKKCDILLGGGGPRFVTVCDRGGGVKNHQKKRDILYGRPLCCMLSIKYVYTTTKINQSKTFYCSNKAKSEFLTIIQNNLIKQGKQTKQAYMPWSRNISKSAECLIFAELLESIP